MLSEALSGILGFLVGGLVGHRLAIRRDKRREFNEAAAPIVQQLLEIEDQVRAGYLSIDLDQDLVARIKPYLTERERKQLRALVDQYNSSVISAHPSKSEKPYEGSKADLALYPSIMRSLVKLRRFLEVQ